MLPHSQLNMIDASLSQTLRQASVDSYVNTVIYNRTMLVSYKLYM